MSATQTASDRDSLRAAIKLQKKRGKLKKAPALPRREVSRAAERTLAAGNERAIKSLEKMGKRLIATLPTVLQKSSALGEFRSDSIEDDIEKWLGPEIARFIAENAHTVRNAAQDASGQMLKETGKILQAQFSRMGIELELDEIDRKMDALREGMAAANKQWVERVGRDYATKISQTVIDSGLANESIETIAAKLTKNFTGKGIELESAKKRARTVAVDQLGKFKSTVERERQTGLGVDGYRWRSSRDERVRELHARLDEQNEIHLWSDPPPDPQGHPGQPINCRCYAEPVLDDLVDDPDSI